jgi:isopenicillin N synthase-like dioxygenase
MKDRLAVPRIDIAAWFSGDSDDRRSVAARVGAAASTVGFMQIVGHQIPDRALSGLMEAVDRFFALPLQEKKRVCPPSPGVNRGYTAPRTERLSHSLGIYSPDDLFEAFNIGCEAIEFPGLALPPDIYSSNIWPAGMTDFRAGIETWYGQAQALAHTMTAIFATALGLTDGYFEPYTDHSIDVLRVNHYQIPEVDARLEPGQLGMGPHTDYGIVTVLWADPLPGLQILDSESGWRDVVPDPGALLINLGDLLARWTGDRWRSTMHRVLAPIDDAGRPYRRRSAAFFHDGNADAEISTLPTSPAVPAASYEPITVAEHLAAKLGGSRKLEINPNAAREASRLAGDHP